MQQTIQKIQELTGKKYVKLTQSGDHAIKHIIDLAINLQKDRIVIQDQGGWLTYKSYARKAGLMIIETKTDYGLVDIADFEKKITANSLAIVNSLTGYFAEQSMNVISQKCKEKNCLLVNDISGSVGTEIGKFGNILICSCGTYKPINLGYGGFIATNDEELFTLIQGNTFDEKQLTGLLREIEKLPARRELFSKVSEKIKKDLKDFEIIHRENKGMNVIVKFNSESEKKKIIEYCEKNNYHYTLCPRYIRVLENAVSIEVKRLKLNDELAKKTL